MLPHDVQAHARALAPGDELGVGGLGDDVVDDAEREQRMLQLALYRLAYHRRMGVPMAEIDVALYYVADDLVIRDDRGYSEEELLQRWMAARAAR